MKKFRRRISIVLTLVLVITSFGFTGAFAVDNGEEGVVGQEVQAVEQTEDVDATEPAEETAPADDVAPAEEAAAPAEEVTPEEAAVEAPDAVEEPAEPEVEDPVAASSDTETFTVTWKDEDGTVLEVDEGVKKGDDPKYDGEEPTKAEDKKYTYKFDGWDPELAPVKKNVTYTAKYTATSKGYTKPAAPVLLKNADGKAFASYKSVWIEWKPVTKDVNGDKYAKGVKIRYIVRPKNKALKTKTVADKYHSEKKLKAFTNYTFYVKTVVVTPDGDKLYSKEVAIKGTPIKTIRYRLTIKQGTTLTKHAGKGPRTYSLSGGQTIDTDRFQTGKYIFEYKGSIFYISKTRVGSAKALYNKRGSWNYSAKEATYYVNDRNANSKTNAMVFINTFAQHGFYFVRANKKSDWVCKKNWECATGLASTPTPTGNYGEKYIHDHIRKKNGINFWNLFNGNAALHGTKPNDKRVGMVISNGCVRNPDNFAKFIYQNAKMKSRVLIV